MKKPPIHPNCRCKIEPCPHLGLDFEAACYNWPSDGDDRIMIFFGDRRFNPGQTKAFDHVKKELELAQVTLQPMRDKIEQLQTEKAVANIVNALELEKLLQAQAQLEQARGRRWSWFAWGVASSPFLAKFFQWLGTL